MKKYTILISGYDVLHIEADSKEEAEQKASEYMSDCGGLYDWEIEDMDNHLDYDPNTTSLMQENDKKAMKLRDCEDFMKRLVSIFDAQTHSEGDTPSPMSLAEEATDLLEVIRA